MPIAFRCTTCGHKLRAPDGVAGRKCRCKCGSLVAIPQPETVPAMCADEDVAPSTAPPAAQAADVYDLVSAWSPLCSSLDNSGSGQFAKASASAWPIILIGAAGLVVVLITIAGFLFLPDI